MAEIITCPSCQRKLQIPEQFFGQTVQCPDCRHMFVAVSSAVSAQPISTPAPPPASDSANKRRTEDDWREDDSRRRRRFEDDDDDDDFDRRSLRQHFTPHRGGLIMALGLASLVGGMS